MHVATTKSNTFLLSTSGVIYSWGAKTTVLGRNVITSQDAQKPAPILHIQTKVIAMVAGTHHMLALDTAGNVFSWGENNFGQLGALEVEFQTIPKEIQKFKLEPVVQIYAGGDSSYAVTKKGNLYVWGDVIFKYIYIKKE